MVALGTAPAILSAGDLSESHLQGTVAKSTPAQQNFAAVPVAVYDGTLDKLGGMSLRELSEFHKKYLMETYIPNWNRGLDLKYGGFANALNPGQEPNFEKKGMYFQGRGVWMFSYLYNNITHDKNHLEAALRGRDFLIKSAMNEDYSWNSFVSRDGTKKLTVPLDHYGDIYMVQGLTELYKATKDERDLEIAIKTAHSVMQRLVSPSYQHVDAHTKALEPGTRRLASWQHFLGALNPLLKVKRDPAIENIARYCVRVMCEDHWQPGEGIFLEILDDRFRPYSFDAENWGDYKPNAISGWHSIQASWMVMEEALRVGHYPTYRKGFDMGISTLEKTYLDGYGVKEGMTINTYKSNSLDGITYPWGALDDVLSFCITALEHSHEPAAIDYYNKCFALHNSKIERTVHSGLLHTPRRFFHTIATLERIIQRNGKISGELIKG